MRVSDTLELELPTAGSHHVGYGNLTPRSWIQKGVSDDILDFELPMAVSHHDIYGALTQVLPERSKLSLPLSHLFSCKNNVCFKIHGVIGAQYWTYAVFLRYLSN